MFTVQPPLIRKYFHGRSRKSLTHPGFSSFYLSWEDAIWHLLIINQVRPGSTILVPSFYCGNVIEHMEQHGLKVATYQVDYKLSINPKVFAQIIKNVKPRIVVIFHPVGITSNLMANHHDWLKSILSDTLIIEDCVHKIVDRSKIKFLTKHHYHIDSLRKVIPLQGSFIYSQKKLKEIGLFQSMQTLPYRVVVTLLWIIMQLNLLLSYKTTSKRLSLLVNMLAEKSMIFGYTLIGSNYHASPGWGVMERLAKQIKVKEIVQLKVTQAKIYVNTIKPILNTGNLWLPQMNPSDYGQLRGFPIIINLKIADKFLSHMRNNGILLRFELNDSEWSNQQKILYLPMGMHVTVTDMQAIFATISQFQLPTSRSIVDTSRSISKGLGKKASTPAFLASDSTP